MSIFRFALNLFKGKTDLKCSWSVPVAPPATDVYLEVESSKEIEATTAEVWIFQVLGGQEISIAYIPDVPFKEKSYIHYKWRTQPAKGGNFEAGEYHFRVKVNGNPGETTEGLKLKDVIQRNLDTFTPSSKKKDPVKI
jgi:hypothetical protein